jgi:arylsulfatase A-like enzyme
MLTAACGACGGGGSGGVTTGGERAGAHHASATEPAASEEVEAGEGAPTAGEGTLAGEGAPAGGAASPPSDAGRVRIRYDLAAHLARAELRQGDSQVIDFGVPGAAKYTLGGWRTRVGADRREGEGSETAITASVIENVTGFVLVPSDVPGPRTLRIRARAVRDGRVTIYVDGETVGLATLPDDGSWGTIRVELPAERLRAGENTIQLRVPRAGPLPGIANAGLLIDWIRLGSADDPHAEEAPPPPERLVRGEGETRTLAIPDGWTLGWTAEIPEGARLRGVARGTGAVDILAHRDGYPPLALGTVDRPGPFDLDLATIAGDLVRIDLHARGEVELVRPAIVTLDATLPRARPRIRNVVVYLTDTLRADKLRPYRAETHVRTPALDSWARRAAVMLRGHSQENWTKPSVATLLSGLFPWEHQATGEDSVLPASVELLSESLARQGFYTGAFVANGFCSDRFGFRQGWNVFRNYIREGRRSQAEFVAADVIAFLDRRPADRPFFLYVHTIDPHVPYMPPRDLLALYDPDPYTGVVDFARDRLLLENIKSGRIHLEARDRRRLEALYDGEITYHDRHFGAIMDALESRGLADETIVVFTADHGEEFWDHDSVGHGHSVWQELIQVPLIVRVPGVTDDGMRLGDAVGLVDVLPTIYDALGLPVPPQASGESFFPQLLGAAADAPRFTVTGFMDGWRAINVGRLKLIHRTERRFQLYDVATDPDETRDLAAERPIAVRYARGLLGLGLAAAERPVARPRAQIAAERTDVDPALRRQLEALGYVGAPRPQAADNEERPSGDRAPLGARSRR